jgi:hypothetical protein
MEVGLSDGCPLGRTNKLKVQFGGKLDLSQGRHEIAQKSSKIVLLGAPLSPTKHEVLTSRGRVASFRCTPGIIQVELPIASLEEQDRRYFEQVSSPLKIG